MIQELLDARHERIEKRKFYKEETRLGRYIQYIGLIFLAIFIVILIYSGVFFGVPIIVTFWEKILFFIGILLLIVGIGLIKRASQSDLSIDEEAFLDVCESLGYIDRYLKTEKKEWLRKKASEKLSEVVDNIDEPVYHNEIPILWESITKEQTKNVLLLKQNFNEKLLPSITKGYGEDLEKAYSIIEQFGKFLLNPTNLELQVINKSMSELKTYKKETVSVLHALDKLQKHFDSHPNMRFLPTAVAFAFCGALVSYLSIRFGQVTMDTALNVGSLVFLGLCTLYAGYVMLKK